MDARLPALAEHLLLIERELRVQGWWREEAPSAEALASVEPFCVDTLDFDQWLQWIFLPRMKLILEHNQPLPNASGILAMAEMVYVDRPEQSRNLKALLAQFDKLIIQSR
ncbi:tRNA pseudouridine synthase C [compost metagenome]